jgi:hypothetical protein
LPPWKVPPVKRVLPENERVCPIPAAVSPALSVNAPVLIVIGFTKAGNAVEGAAIAILAVSVIVLGPLSAFAAAIAFRSSASFEAA